MKKQFFRVKQLADQTFLRAEKSEVLNHEELQIADQRVDAIRSAITSINKKICPNGPINDREKRLKKCQEYQIGSTFVEEAREEKDCLLFQHILRLSGHTEQDLAKDYAEHEAKVEEMVYAPLQKVVEHDLPSILKQKHNLKKYCLDKDSASNRYHSTKKETLKEDMEEADTKVEQSRDQLAIEMFHLISRENEFASYVLQLLKLQRGYHESALKNLETIIPELEKTIGDSHIKKVFGVPLEEHLRVTGKRLAYPLEICITTLLEFGMSEEGLFRIAGGMSKVKRLRAAIDSGCFSCLIPEYRDVHVLASTLKLYLRELPEPLLTFHLHKDWMQSMQYPENQRLEVVKHLLSRLPQENRDNLAYLIQFLARMTQHTENKMTSSNLAIVMAPNLLWNKNEEINVNMGNCVTINMLVELFVKEVNTLFPDDVSGYVTITSLIPDEDITSRNGNNGKSQLEHVDATSTESLLDSPKPNLRKKKPAAPIPPNPPTLGGRSPHEADHHQDKLTSSYPSGSTTLNRPPKGRDHHVKVKSTVGVNTEENELSLSRKRSFSKDDIKSVTVMSHSQTSAASTNHVPGGQGHGAGPAQSNVAVTAHVGAVAAPPQNPTNLVSDAGATRVVTQAVTSVSKAQPVIKPVAQNVVAEEDRSYRTTVTHHVGGPPPSSDGGSSPRPVAAPRQSLMADEKSGSTSVSRNSSIRSTGGGAGGADDVMSKSHNSLDYADVQLRRSEMLVEKPAKPEIPARPASLAPAKRSSMDIDPTLHRTQCLVYSVANKQQPSIVNIQNRNEKIQLGHDVMMAEKEKFLGHHQTSKTNLENKFNDINSNKDKPPRPTSIENKPSIPPKSPSAITATKSNEQLLVDISLDLTKASDNQPGGGQAAVSKSSEKLNEINENKTHRKTSHHTHTRTRSDGNIMELGGHHRAGEFLLQTPPSPRSLNKPTEPPPPPPVAVVKKREPESTDF